MHALHIPSKPDPGTAELQLGIKKETKDPNGAGNPSQETQMPTAQKNPKFEIRNPRCDAR